MKNLTLGSVVLLAGLRGMGAAGGSPKKTLETSSRAGER